MSLHAPLRHDLRGMPRWVAAFLIAAAGVIVPTLVLLAAMAGRLSGEQLAMRPKDVSRFALLQWRCAPQGCVYRVLSTSPPDVVLVQRGVTHVPVCFARHRDPAGEWLVLIPQDTSRLEELGAFLRNEDGYWVAETPYRDRRTDLSADEWRDLWSRAEARPAAGETFADIAR